MSEIPVDEAHGQCLLGHFVGQDCDFKACFVMGCFALSTFSTPIFWLGRNLQELTLIE